VLALVALGFLGDSVAVYILCTDIIKLPSSNDSIKFEITSRGDGYLMNRAAALRIRGKALSWMQQVF
jgi:hypothetical protein